MRTIRHVQGMVAYSPRKRAVFVLAGHAVEAYGALGGQTPHASLARRKRHSRWPGWYASAGTYKGLASGSCRSGTSPGRSLHNASRTVSYVRHASGERGRESDRDILQLHTATAEYFLHVNCSFGVFAAPAAAGAGEAEPEEELELASSDDMMAMLD